MSQLWVNGEVINAQDIEFGPVARELSSKGTLLAEANTLLFDRYDIPENQRAQIASAALDVSNACGIGFDWALSELVKSCSNISRLTHHEFQVIATPRPSLPAVRANPAQSARNQFETRWRR